MAMIEPDTNQPLRKFFSGLVEQVFMSELGVCDTTLADYLSNLLADFIHVNSIYRLRTVDGDAILDISRMHTDACLGPDVEPHRREWLIHKHIGDFTLFWTGVYPENLSGTRARGADRLREYLLSGKRAYVIASELSRPGTQPPGEVLRNLGEQFEYCVHGLHLVRAGWERQSPRMWSN